MNDLSLSAVVHAEPPQVLPLTEGLVEDLNDSLESHRALHIPSGRAPQHALITRALRRSMTARLPRQSSRNHGKSQ